MRISDWSSDVCSSDLMPFDSGRFDTVVTTFTLCSVADQAAVLAEIRRVLKPGGTALFLEHGGAPDAGVARWQRRIEPVWKRIGGNCHLTRPIADAYSAAGFAVRSEEHTSELQSLMRNSYAVFCLKNKKLQPQP